MTAANYHGESALQDNLQNKKMHAKFKKMKEELAISRMIVATDFSHSLNNSVISDTMLLKYKNKPQGEKITDAPTVNY